MQHIKLETISIKQHPEINEIWVQKAIASDPTILGLGDVLLRDKERRQPRAGRLDLLLQDPDNNKRYEVEVQLGPTDESHIVRTIEYWDLERKRYPQYDHCAVLVAEDITSRFLNIVSLFNGMIPLVAIQVNAIKVGEGIGLTFTKVIDELALGLIDEDEESHEVTDRDYWIKRGSKKTIAMADKILEIVKSIDAQIEFKYNKFYIGLAKAGIPNNFITCRPKKQWVSLQIRLPENSSLNKKLEEAELDAEYVTRLEKYNLRIREGDIKTHCELLKELIENAHKNSRV